MMGVVAGIALARADGSKTFSSADEALVVDDATADVADHNAVLVATDTTRDLLLVHNVVTNARCVKDLTVEAGTFVEYSTEVRAEILMALRENRASRIFDHTVG
jgi:hypothetical protein